MGAPLVSRGVAIAPDTKNWTWVLERTCPECGFDVAALDVPAVAELTRRVADRWVAVLAGPDVASRPRPDRWSALEYGCHVRDVFTVFDGRLALMLAEDDPAFPDWDQDRTAVESRYGEQDPAVVAGELATAGHRLADRLDTVTTADLGRAGRRSDGSAFTIESFARYFVHDPVHHLHDVGHPLTG